MASVLIIGQDTRFVDFTGLPPTVTPEWIIDGLNTSKEQLKAAGHSADLLLVDDGATAGAVVAERLRAGSFEVIVIGAGLRMPPKHARLLEAVVNAVREEAPDAKIAFNMSPGDSADAALRFL
jgi:hypothetical protein